MNFEDLHELLRLDLLRRISLGSLTGAQLARMTGFQQAHISNFLNRRRSLSLEGLDRVLTALSLTIESILPMELSASAAPGESASPELTETVPVVSSSTLLDDPVIESSSIIETLRLPSAQLCANPTRTTLERAAWQRFAAVRVDVDQAAPMDPVLTPGAVVIVDRHYNSLVPFRSHQPSMYAVRYGRLLFRYVTFDENRLILRPAQLSYPVLFQTIAAADSPSAHIVGRVCMVLNEL